MAGAPNLVRVAAILHRATQVRAHRRESMVLTIVGKKQQPRARAKAKNLRSVWLQVANFASDHFVAAQFGDGRRNEVAQHRINKGNDRGDNPASEKGFDEAAARGLGSRGFAILQ